MTVIEKLSENPGFVAKVVVETPDASVHVDSYGQAWFSKRVEDGKDFILSHPVVSTDGLACPICLRGWDARDPTSIGDQFRDKDAPEGKRLMHEACYSGHLARSQYEHVSWAFSVAGIVHDGIVEVPNEYLRLAGNPWYKVVPKVIKSPVGSYTLYRNPEFKVGWRKDAFHAELILPELMEDKRYAKYRTISFIKEDWSSMRLLSDDVYREFDGKAWDQGDPFPDGFDKSLMILSPGAQSLAVHLSGMASLLLRGCLWKNERTDK